MSRRNNSERTKSRRSQAASAQQPVQTDRDQLASALRFVAPTEFVELPSLGKGYPEGHPLKDKEVLEIHFMTARHEDILTSQSLLKKGMAFSKLIESLLVDRTIDPNSILLGDRAAIMIAARSSAYGNQYNTVVTCPACGESQKKAFDLNERQMIHGNESEEY